MASIDEHCKESSGPVVESRARDLRRAKQPPTLFLQKIVQHPLVQSCNPCLILENSGSVARDHLASERTFLSYMRTSLVIASTGVALVQLFALSAATSGEDINKFSRPLGSVVITVGLGTLVLGLVRYFSIQNALTKGHYPVARLSIVFLTFLLVAILITVFAIMLTARP